MSRFEQVFPARLGIQRFWKVSVTGTWEFFNWLDRLCDRRQRGSVGADLPNRCKCRCHLKINVSFPMICVSFETAE